MWGAVLLCNQSKRDTDYKKYISKDIYLKEQISSIRLKIQDKEVRVQWTVYHHL